MKKFKLIKEFPGSPKLGTIVSEMNPNFILQMGGYGIVDGGNIQSMAPKRLVEGHVEFWEEILEKDYEILSFISTEPHKSGHVVHEGQVHFKENIKRYLECYTWDIHSVKRLSDGEIFTLGDFVSGLIAKNVKIDKIVIYKDSIRIENISYVLNFSKIKHFNTPIFTTEDGVDIFEGDKFYWTNKSGQSDISLATSAKKGTTPVDCKHYLKFSTEESAKKYIRLHSKSLSISDCMNTISKFGNHGVKFSTLQLEDIKKELIYKTK